jgi:nucleoid-associated protein YgaU
VSREQKLALILGFLAVLVVAILISDHYSDARRDTLAGNVAEVPPVVDVPAGSPYAPVASRDGSTSFLGAAMASGTPSATPGPYAGDMPRESSSTLASGAPATLPPTLPPALPPTRTQSPLPTDDPGLPDAALASGDPATVPGGGTTGLLSRALDGAGDPEPVTLVQGGSPATGGDRDTSLVDDLAERFDRLRAAGAIRAVPVDGTDPSAAGSSTNPDGTPNAAPNSGRTGPAPVPTPAPTATERWHSVATGESLYSIAARYYGNGNHWKKLAEANKDRIKNDQVRVGVRLRVPDNRSLGLPEVRSTPSTPERAAQTPRSASGGTPARTPTPAPNREQAGERAGERAGTKPPVSSTPAASGRTYTVKKGDSLGTIAQRELGTMKRASEIVTLNKLKDANAIYVGQTLRLPAK